MRSKGSAEFSRLPGGVVKVSERLGAGGSKSNVSKWRLGESLPPANMRERIFELWGIGPDAWDEPVEISAAVAPVAGEVTAEHTASAAALILATVQAMHTELNAGGSDLDIKQRSAIAANLVAMVDKLGHHTGIKLTARQILGAPIFIEICARLVAALEPWPDAMLAAADAIEELEAKP